jgi:membrane-associated phospholipid phosphatase
VSAGARERRIDRRALSQTAAGLTLSAIGAIYAIASSSGSGRRFEEHVRFASAGDLGAFADPAEFLLAVLLPAAAIAVVLLLAGRALRGDRCSRSAIAVFVVANAATQLLKRGLEAVDPLGGEALRHTAGAFPSGHATLAASTALAILVAAPGTRRWVAILALATVALVNVDLVLAGWHYPSDIASGTLVALACAAPATSMHVRRWAASAVAGGAACAVLGFAVLTDPRGLVAYGLGYVTAAIVAAGFVGWCSPRGIPARDPRAATRPSGHQTGRCVS